MTATPETAPVPAESDGGSYDVVIVGAGFSGIGAAYRIAERNPGTRYVILERRDRIGGTWDLFRYPGVRSDSSIFSLSWPWEPWVRKEGVADGDHIREYMEDTARKHGILSNIHFGTHVQSADWDSATDAWTVHAEENGERKTYRGRFVFFGSGYYNYDEGYTPDFPGLETFAGTVVHPQFWPEDLDYTGKNVIVIGSGATAISLIPALAQKAAKVTMLQRSPTFLLAGSRVNPLIEAVRKVVPRKISHAFARYFAVAFESVVWFLARTVPGVARKIIRAQNVSRLPAGYPVDVHFKPRYNVWDQRLCLVADGDLFEVISDGRAEVVTDHIDRFDDTGVTLKSGKHLAADIIVTATGLQLQALGGVRITLDGNEIKPQERFSYKAHMLEDVPNLIWCIGYTNASWTLRADMTARAAAKLIEYMNTHGYTHAFPHLGGEPIAEKPAWDIQAGYVLRNLHALPKSGLKRPWVVRQNYLADAFDHHFIDKIDEDMTFGRVASPAQVAG
ncbi:FAD-dependent oxidoreductase [Mycolicibacterium aromaticivorans JS19b1 = JCM 16368]|uniref:FAD-dependent oxidoreductase n=1 Tax=Mycolicibacterium aromaticivorans JS19b1 = JCM 16368 TaxID=1440774 RepID=A0A064CJ55_9MYCO|nr:NAD(P)/FAD-dependent oxidoreductase [Mycolicibacterium aromaticivorans]KDF00640.1 FAD-dependent oxidoreductase [Mycolicibacterium aromaticivorans JS19b1 = JCM 16368]